MAWKRYESIAELPDGLWDTRVARGNAALDSRLIRVAERAFPDTTFEYRLQEENGRPTALILWTLKDRIACCGTPESSGPHGWLDESALDRATFLQEVTAMSEHEFNILTFNDFTENKALEWAPAFAQNGFHAVPALDLSRLTIPEHIRTLDEFPTLLNAKHRYQWHRYRAAIDWQRFEIETVTDYLPILDELYPLYIMVSERASEYRAEPHSKDYFRIAKEEFGDDAAAVVIREKGAGKILGFMLLLYGQGGCVHQYIGFCRRDELFLWHNLVIESIGDALNRAVRRINLGVTHAATKRKFGAASEKMFTFIR